MSPQQPEQSNFQKLSDVTVEDDFVDMSTAFGSVIYVQKDKRFDLDRRPYLPVILEATSTEVTLKCGRQLGKSTIEAGILGLHGAATPGYGHLYVTPRGEQAKDFSRHRFGILVQESPVLASFKPTRQSNETWQLGMKTFKNGAYYYFLSAYHTADALRGRSAGYICKDEIQDLISDHMAPIDECAANFPDARFYNSGTPKTFQNLLEQKWIRSTQAEWLVKCSGCNFWNFQDHKIIGKYGYICKRCGKDIDINNGQWVMGAPERFEINQGFRITQMMNPNTTHGRLIEKLETYPFSQFCNEVLGLSYAEGDIVLTREDVMRCCDENQGNSSMSSTRVAILHGGIDHGTGNLAAKRSHGRTETSFTVVVCGGFDRDGRFRITYMKRFTGPDSDLAAQPALMNNILRGLNARFVIADWGFGAANNRRMINEFGWSPKRFFEVQESDSQAKFVDWNADANRYIVNRNDMFMKLIDDIKNDRVRFPKRSEMESFVNDFTSIFVELDSDKRRHRYDHTHPDDAFHATAFCYIAALLDAGVLSRFHLQPRV